MGGGVGEPAGRTIFPIYHGICKPHLFLGRHRFREFDFKLAKRTPSCVKIGCDGATQLHPISPAPNLLMNQSKFLLLALLFSGAFLFLASATTQAGSAT